VFGGHQVSFCAEELLNGLQRSDRRGQLELVVVTDHSLGLRGEYSLQQLLDRAKERGFGTCPPEVGPLARLAFREELGEEIFVGMEPAYDDDGLPGLFVLARSSESSTLNGAPVRPQEPFADGRDRPNLWLLVAPKTKPDVTGDDRP